MSRQLPFECLVQIFEDLSIETLQSCLSVCRMWGSVSVSILWTNVQNFNTLISCLPKDSKEILRKNEINIFAQASRPPLFKYATFIKNLSVDDTIKSIDHLT